MTCNWVQQLDDARACGLAGVILEGNTADRVFGDDAQGPPLGLKYFLATKFHTAGNHVGHFSLSSGFSMLVPPGEKRECLSQLDRLTKIRDTDQLFRDLGRVLRDPEAGCTVIIEYVGHVTPGTGPGMAGSLEDSRLRTLETVHGWSVDDDIRASGNFIVMINNNGEALSSLIEHQGGFVSLRIGLPEEQDREKFTNYLHELGDCESVPVGRLESDFPKQEFARLTNGLRLIDIEQLFRQAAARDADISREQVRTRKKQTINQLCGGLLEVIEPNEDGFNAIAGCDHAKAYFGAIRPLWGRGHAGLPVATLLAGVPGAGKSFLVKAIAKEFNCPCLVMRGVREMWVGASERNLDKILQVVTDLAPCIVWTDEVDQSVGGERSSGPSGDSGTSQRMFSRLLEFFGDSRLRGRVLWIATTNRPDTLDPAIKDRFGVVIPFLHPNRRERAALIPVLAQQVGRRLAPEVDCDQLSAQPELEILTIRSLQEIIVWAGTLADLESGTPETAISIAHLERAIHDYKPSFDPLEHELIALTALQMTSFISLMPWMTLNGEYSPDNTEWPAYLTGIINPNTGKLDSEKLERRIREITQQRIGRRVA